ncbi:MAG: hypothetical protein JWP78_1665 [Mucilaginibacter sp.]|jgi:membrane protein implicated in regulation of membrane protease activity|nr:hypothetical protein [Mucilaginibacter sp.]
MMENDELYDHIQEIKTAFIITLLIAVYCFSVIMKSIAVHLKWKEICSGIGFSIVALVDIWLLIRLVKLVKASKDILDNS